MAEDPPSPGRGSGRRAMLSGVVADPYRSGHAEGRALEPDHRPRRRVHRAGIATALLGAGIGATAPVLGPAVLVVGGAVALLGLSLFREAPTTAMKAPCPSCGAEVGGIDPGLEVVRCEACDEYVGCGSGALYLLRDDFVARSPVFAVPIRAASPLVRFAPICAKCGAGDATHAVPVPVPFASAIHAPDDPGSIVMVPHCARHHDGADGAIGAVRVCSRALWLSAMEPSDPSEGAADDPAPR